MKIYEEEDIRYMILDCNKHLDRVNIQINYLENIGKLTSFVLVLKNAHQITIPPRFNVANVLWITNLHLSIYIQH